MEEETDIQYIEDEICRIHHELKEKKGFAGRIQSEEVLEELDEHFVEFFKILQQCQFLIDSNKKMKKELLESQSLESNLEINCS